MPRYTSPVPPYLSRFGLYYDRWFDEELHRRFNNDALFAVDGRHSVSQIARHTGIPFEKLDEYLRRFLAPKLIAPEEPGPAFLRSRDFA